MNVNRENWSVSKPRSEPGRGGACAAPGCDAVSEYRAPLSRNRVEGYVWLCLDHVREYNAAWDYYAGMSEREIEAHRRADVTWRRPSWPFGAHRVNGDGYRIRDDFGVFEDSIGRTEGWRAAGRAAGWEPETEEQRALALFELAPPVTVDTIKARYKELVKRLHPDANGGDKQAEERLKLVNQAYSTLKSSDWLIGDRR